MPHLIYIIFLFAFGACIGSFLNVVVYRLPRGESLIHPPSRCPSCEHPLAWFDNLPVIGWILLGGKCRYCKNPISPRYPIVEAALGSLFAIFYVAIFIGHQGPFWAVYSDQDDLMRPVVLRMASFANDWPIFVLYLFTVSCLLAASLVDAEHYLVPPGISWLMAVAGVVVHTLVDRESMPGALCAGPLEIALAAGAGVGLVLSLILLRLGVLPLSFAQGQPALEVDKLRHKEGQEEPADFTPRQVRAEIRKEILFLLPPLLLGGLAAFLEMNAAPVHGLLARAATVDWLSGFFGSLLGGLVGAGVVWLTRVFGSLAFGKEAMGLGDVDLMFGVGAVVGAGAATVAFLMAPFLGIPLAVGMFLFKARRQLPYVPYLSMAAVVVMLFYFPIYDYLRPGLVNLLRMLT